MKSILGTKNCFGCGVCASVCPKNTIKIKLNFDGFYEPIITNESDCIKCGLCNKVCSFNNDYAFSEKPNIKSYAAWSRNSTIREKCSSGGIAFEIGKSLINQGYKVCGVRYNAEEKRAEHYIANTLDELVPSMGSKYIQSYTVDAFRNINRKQKYLVVGTPCQIASFRRYIQNFHCEENFVLMDFFCHGVPSYFAWKKYLQEVEKKTGPITYVSWRNKQTGWHDSWAMTCDINDSSEKVDWHDSYSMIIKEKKSLHYSRMSQGDAFYKLFLGDQCLGKACYDSCMFKYNHSLADIRVGDAWGHAYENDDKGVSAAISFTAKGDDLIHSCDCEIKEHSFILITEFQMKTNAKRKFFHKKLMKLLRDENKNLEEIIRYVDFTRKISRQIDRIKHPLRTIKKAIGVLK